MKLLGFNISVSRHSCGQKLIKTPPPLSTPNIINIPIIHPPHGRRVHGCHPERIVNHKRPSRNRPTMAEPLSRPHAQHINQNRHEKPNKPGEHSPAPPLALNRLATSLACPFHAAILHVSMILSRHHTVVLCVSPRFSAISAFGTEAEACRICFSNMKTDSAATSSETRPWRTCPVFLTPYIASNMTSITGSPNVL